MIAGVTVFVGATLLALIDLGTAAQIFGVTVMVIAALRVGLDKQKDQTIATLQDSTSARLERIKDLEADLKGCNARADVEHERRREAETTIANLQGKLQQMERYTAKEAFETLTAQLASIETAIVTAIQSNNELVMRNTEIVSSRLPEPRPGS